MEEKKKLRDIKIRVTEEEYEEIRQRKDDHGLSFTDYARFTMIGPEAAHKFPDRKALAAMLGELGKIGSNVNQIARAYNLSPMSAHLPEKDFQRIQQNIQAVRDYIAKAVKL